MFVSISFPRQIHSASPGLVPAASQKGVTIRHQVVSATRFTGEPLGEAETQELFTKQLNGHYLPSNVPLARQIKTLKQHLKRVAPRTHKLLTQNQGVGLVGYSDVSAIESKQPGFTKFYEKVGKQILSGMIDGRKQILFVTSPTMTPGSVDLIINQTALGQRPRLKVLQWLAQFPLARKLFNLRDIHVINLISQEYARYSGVKDYLHTHNARFIEQYKALPKYLFKERDAYLKAEADFCDTAIVFGGREASVKHVVEALKDDDDVYLIDHPSFPDSIATVNGKTRINNAGRYLLELQQEVLRPGSIPKEKLDIMLALNDAPDLELIKQSTELKRLQKVNIEWPPLPPLKQADYRNDEHFWETLGKDIGNTIRKQVDELI